MKNNTLAIIAAVSATIKNPKKPAMIAMIKNTTAHPKNAIR
ncbi:MAG: hypothetical protein RL557_141 [archaeon]